MTRIAGKPKNPEIDEAEVAICLRVLEALVEDRARLAGLPAERRRALLMAAGRLAHPDKAAHRRLSKALRRQDREAERAHDRALLGASANRSARTSPLFVLPASTAKGAVPPEPSDKSVSELRRPRACYVCKQPYRRVHHFYDSLCPSCAELNYAKRTQSARLDGQVALVTGARIKVGYQVTLKLLRAGARVVATTRFVHDAARRYAAEPDFAAFRERLLLHELDLVHTPSVEAFARHLAETLPRLDLLVNNAAQTVRRPPAFYAHLRALALDEPAAMARLEASGGAPLVLRRDFAPSAPWVIHEQGARWRGGEEPHAFPPGQLDLDEQQLDLRPINSWRLRLGEVSTVELLEVHLVNAVAPFVLANALRPLMAKDRTDQKHVSNVSAMEAQFSRRKKTINHPHTNMAKAALNMMTRTAAADWAADGIFLNSVDTGWVTDEDPLDQAARKQQVHDFHPPLDAIDAAARVLDPLFSGLASGCHPYGLFWKDYRPVEW